MKTLFLLLVLVVIGIVTYNLLKKKKLPTTTLPPVDPTTTLPPKPVNFVYYQLYRCDTEEKFETGPVDLNSFNSGQRVEGATNVFYVVTISSSQSFGYQNIMVTKTGLMGC